jgi:hypothetical protein
MGVLSENADYISAKEDQGFSKAVSRKSKPFSRTQRLLMKTIPIPTKSRLATSSLQEGDFFLKMSMNW